MTHRPLAPRVALLAALMLIGLVTACSRPPPDVYLITVDTLRPDHLGAWGYASAHTPTLDRLAARGHRVAGATTPFPRTSPAMASLMTGLTPESHGSREVGAPVRSGVPLAELLRTRGYETLGINANAAAGRAINLHHGFQTFVELGPDEEKDGADVTDRALAALASAKPDEPLFLWAHYLDPHTPYAPPGVDPEDPCYKLQRQMDEEESRGPVFVDRGGVASAVLPACVKLYDGEIADADAQIGRLLAGLAAARPKQAERALVIVTSDHGESLGEWGLYYEHGPNLADAVLRVPLIFAGEGIPPGVDEAVFRLQDVMPTILGLLGIPQDARPVMNGLDLSERVRGKEAPANPILMVAESGSALQVDMFTFPVSGPAFGRHCWNDPPWSLCTPPLVDPPLYDHRRDPGLTQDVSAAHRDVAARLRQAATRWPAERARQLAVRTSAFKLVATPQLAGDYRYALYDLRADPAETTDVSEQHPELLDSLKKELGGWRSGLPIFEPQPRSPEQLEFLKTLGYME